MYVRSRSRICQAGTDHGDRRVRAYNRGLGGRAPSGPGAEHHQSPWNKAPWSWKPRVHFHIKDGPKVKDLKDFSPPCLRQTAFDQWGAPGPPVPGSASRVCHFLTFSYVKCKQMRPSMFGFAEPSKLMFWCIWSTLAVLWLMRHW